MVKKKTPTPSADTIQRLRIYVQSLRGHWTQLAAETGLNGHWLTAFARGRIAVPQHDKVIALETHEAKFGKRRYVRR